jgi:hypothetical protein
VEIFNFRKLITPPKKNKNQVNLNREKARFLGLNFTTLSACGSSDKRGCTLPFEEDPK